MQDIIHWLEELTQPNTAEETMITLTIVSISIALIGVIVSGVAIFYAIQVPKKIAERQDKTALFEKRYEVYKDVSDFLVGVIEIEGVLDRNYSETELKEELTKILHNRLQIDKDNIDKSDVRKYQVRFLVKMGFLEDRIRFLYTDDISKRFIDLFERSTDIICLKYDDKDIPIFKTCHDNFWKQDIIEMEKYLKL